MTQQTIDLETRRKRLQFRGWHRGIKEADLILGGFIDIKLNQLSHDDCEWFETLFEEQDVDILAWITGKEETPSHLDHPFIKEMGKLDYIPKAK